MSLTEFKKKIKKNSFRNNIFLWFYPYKECQSLLSNTERKIAESLPNERNKLFTFSRGCARNALSSLFSVDCMEVPLIAIPGEPPKLEDDLGHISFSHSPEAFVIAWSYAGIGIDIENSRRKINNLKLFSKFFRAQEKEFFSLEENTISFLSNWVLLESAIKWNRGGIYQDIKDWQLNKSLTLATNKKKKLQVYTKLINYKKFLIGIACNNLKVDQKIIICE